MSSSYSGFTPQQLLIIAQVKELMKRLEEHEIHVTGISEYEVVAFQDANGKPFLSFL